MARDYMRDQLAPMYLEDVKKILQASPKNGEKYNIEFVERKIKNALEQIEKYEKMSSWDGLGN